MRLQFHDFWLFAMLANFSIYLVEFLPSVFDVALASEQIKFRQISDSLCRKFCHLFRTLLSGRQILLRTLENQCRVRSKRLLFQFT